MEELLKYEKELIEEEKAKLKPQYQYIIEDLSCVIDDDMLENFNCLKEAVENGNQARINELADKFEKAYKEYAKPWWDEDIGIFRSGMEWESDFYKRLYTIASKNKEEGRVSNYV